MTAFGSTDREDKKSSMEVGTSVNNSSSPSTEGKKRRIRLLNLYRAALSGDWNSAKDIFQAEDKTAIITKERDTVLHIAAAAESSTFANNLVLNMTSSEDLSIKNKVGNTAFCLAAATGKVDLAKLMVIKYKELNNENANLTEENKNLAMIRGSGRMLPIDMAALFGHEEMVKYLYKETGDKLSKDDCIKLLVILIDTGLYDRALELLAEKKDLAFASNGKETALHALARMPMNTFSDTYKSRQRKLPQQARTLVECLWEEVISNLDDEQVSKFISEPWPLTFVAAKQGNIEFLTILISKYPKVLLEFDNNNYSIFHHAVLNRHDDIFQLIHEVGTIKDLIAPLKDEEGNNILHLAGKLAPPNRLNIVTGAALQMQQELLWFEKVRKIMYPLDAEAENEDEKTPRALFSEKHEKLKKEGESWMKKTAQSCMIVATLIATVVFAAAFTVPGDTDQETGTPHFLRKASFSVFAVADAISLVSSSCSILTFLSILTSRYAEDDFKRWLPTELLIGIITLFLSIVSMMIVFCATFFVIFKDGKLWHAIFVTGIAAIPVILFLILQWRLFVDLLGSTYFCSLSWPEKRNGRATSV